MSRRSIHVFICSLLLGLSGIAPGCGFEGSSEDGEPLGEAIQSINAAASQWRTVRGPSDGTQAIAGTGQLTGALGGYPARVWSFTHASPRFQAGSAVVGNFDPSDAGPEVIGYSQGRVFLWDEGGVVRATSASLPDMTIHGLYDLDGDDDEELLLVGTTAVGRGLVVLDPRTLAIQWTSDDPGFNSSVTMQEVAVVDLTGDARPEIVWDPAFNGISRGFSAVSFAKGMAFPEGVATSLPSGYRNLVMPVAGNYFGLPGSPKTTLATHQSIGLSFFEWAQPGQLGAVCNVASCLRVVGQFPGVTASYTFGVWLSFDANGDGDDEFLSTSEVNPYSVEIAAFDPSAGLAQGTPNTAAGVMWQYRYGINTQYRTHTTAQAVRGAKSSTGERIAPVNIWNAGTDEKNRSGGPANDCLVNPNRWGVVVFDAAEGTPLATLPEARAWASMDSNRDGITEIVAQRDSGQVTGYELSCSGASHAAGWQSCAATGCDLVERWSVPGTLLQYNAQTRNPTESAYTRTSSVVDLNGDDVSEVIVRSGPDLIAYRVDQPSGPIEVGRYKFGACSGLTRIAGQGPNAKILLEGTNCLAVLDAELKQLTSFGVDTFHGSASTLTGFVGAPNVPGVPAIAVGGRVIVDPRGANVMPPLPSPSGFVPRAFADLDGDGLDEVIATRTGSAGAWSVRALRWQGSSFQTVWNVTGTSLSDTNSLRELATAGDFDGDGDLDVAVRSNNTQEDVAYFLDGKSGQLLSKQVLPFSNSMWPMIAGDLCTQASCPGKDGRDDLLIRNLALTTIVRGPSQGQTTAVSHVNQYTTEQAVADFDGDGVNEIATTMSIGAVVGLHLEVRRSNGTPLWTRALSDTTDRKMETAVAYVNGDNIPDLVRGGGYGQIEVFSGSNGSLLPGFPLYLSKGKGFTTVGSKPAPIRHVAAADIDGDGNMEALVAHGDGYLYAVNIATAEGPPSVLWSVPFGVPLMSLNVANLDNDSSLEVLVSAEDGRIHIVDVTSSTVTIDQPAPDGCFTPSTVQISGTSGGVDQVVVSVNGVQVASVATNGPWSAPVVFPGEGEFVVTVVGRLNGVQVTSDTIMMTHWADNDGDGFGECDGDCNDANAAMYPGATELCDGVDNDCDGVIDDGAQQCAEVCDGLDNDGDGVVDEGNKSGNGKRGLTWTQYGVSVNGAQVFTDGCGQPRVGCNDCDPYVGDTLCTEERPILCIKKDPSLTNACQASEPAQFNDGWAAGTIALTEPVLGTDLTSASVADQICAAQFGAGYVMASHHDGNGGWSWRAKGTIGPFCTLSSTHPRFGTPNQSNRFWVKISNQPGNCWD